MDKKKVNKQILKQLETLVDLCPEQRLSQIICNYVFPDYRKQDPFYEEPEDTYKRVEKVLQGW